MAKRTIPPLNPVAQQFVDEQMIPFFEKKAKECLTTRTETFWNKCIEDLKTCPNHFTSTIENRYAKTEDFKLQRMIALEWGKRLHEVQLKKWKPEVE